MPVAVKPFKVGNVEVGGGDLFLIAGPCLVESEAHALKMAHAISSITERLGIPYIFKSSYDKANRTSINAHRGLGIEEALRILGLVRRETGVPVLTDVHEARQVQAAAEVADVLQIPAFLCRQTDLIVEAAKTGKAVNIKKGQFVAPHDMDNSVRKVAECGNPNVFLTERGTTFGYNNLVVDFRSIPIMQETGYPVIFDATHSVQLPGGGGTVSSGQRQYVPTLAKAAIMAGCQGLFMEVHPNPDEAKSDGANQVP